jgi:hypothetical protein
MWACAFSAAVLSVYIQALHSGCAGGDAGELMAMVCSGGIPHPPGYPLLMLLGRAWLVICPTSWGSPAWRLSLLSAIFSAASSGLIAYTSSLCCRQCKLTGLFAGGIWAFSHLTMKFSTQFEVFSLNNLLCSLLLLLTVGPAPHFLHS